MSGETRFWLVRHAPVAGPRGVIHAPDAPADTSDAAALDRLRSQLPTRAAAFCSPARRTVETALALGLAANREPALREQDFGAWTGRSHAELRAELGAAYDAFWQAPASNRPPGGESFEDQIARVTQALAALPQGDIVLVVHSGTVRAALATALGLPAANALHFVVDPLSLTRIDRLDGGWRVIGVNRR